MESLRSTLMGLGGGWSPVLGSWDGPEGICGLEFTLDDDDWKSFH